MRTAQITAGAVKICYTNEKTLLQRIPSARTGNVAENKSDLGPTPIQSAGQNQKISREITTSKRLK
jgi:hypothetical protein